MMTPTEWKAENRQQLKRLDDCLSILEEAHELNLVTVTSAMVQILKTRIPSICEGMRIADAIEEVLRMQEPFMQKLPSSAVDRRKPVPRRRHAYDIGNIIGPLNDPTGTDRNRLPFTTRRGRVHRPQ